MTPVTPVPFGKASYTDNSFFFIYYFIWFFKTGFLSVVLAVLELAL